MTFVLDDATGGSGKQFYINHTTIEYPYSIKGDDIVLNENLYLYRAQFYTSVTDEKFEHYVVADDLKGAWRIAEAYYLRRHDTTLTGIWEVDKVIGSCQVDYN